MLAEGSTMADFDRALAYTLAHEGGWADHPRDPGGPTNFGITLKTAQRYGIRTAAELRAMTPEKVAEIYRDGYWRFGAVADQRVATKLFDMTVNMGLGAAVGLLQAALRSLGHDVAVDRALGATTLAAVNATPPDRLLASLCVQSEAHYRSIVARTPGHSVFLKGWLTRAKAVPQ